MAEQLKISIPEEVCLTTIRTQNSKLWFVNNKKLENEVLAYLAKYKNVYNVIIYGFVLLGNHYHMIAKFPDGNRHLFKKSFNRAFANILKRHIKSYRGGSVWARRYRPQALPRTEDIAHWFFYVALNPISSGLVDSLYDYSGFNSFFWSLTNKSKTFKVIDWEDYQNRKRYNKSITIDECSKEYTLSFSRLPSCEDMTQEQYAQYLRSEYLKRKKIVVKERKAKGKGFLGKSRLRNTPCGAYPITTKTSSRYTKRPLVLSLCAEAKKSYLAQYFAIYNAYKHASALYRSGHLDAKFPPGTFLPTLLTALSSKLN